MLEIKFVIMSRRQRLYGKYVPILADGQVKLYLPLERYSEMNGMKANGYDLSDESQHILELARLIKEAEKRREESERKKQEFIKESLNDFSWEVGSLDIICPYCLGKVNRNWEKDESAVLCGRYDLLTSECNGMAFYTIDRASFVLERQNVEKCICPVKEINVALIHE
jgi:hypothetical protein